MDKQAAEEENSENLLGENRARMTPIRDVRHRLDISTQGIIPKKTLRGDSETLKRDKWTSPAPKRGNSIKPPYGGDDKTSYGDRSNTINGENGTHTNAIGDHRYSVCTPRHSRSTTMPRQRNVRKCVTAFNLDLRRVEENLNNTEAKFSELKYLRNS